MGDDALAHSQLELLYKLGVIEREEEVTAQENNDPHSFLNRLPPPTPLIEAPLRPSIRFSRPSTLYGDLAIQKPSSPAQNKEDDRFDLHLGPRMSRASIVERVPLSPLPIVPSHRRHTSRISIDCQTQKVQEKDQPKSQKRIWFAQWYRSIRMRRNYEKAAELCTELLRRRIMRRWRIYTHRRHLLQSQCDHMDRLQAKRSIKRWRTWSVQRIRVTILLAGRRYTLMSQLRKRRIWKRWCTFMTWQQQDSRQRKLAHEVWRKRVLYHTWLVLRVHAFNRSRRRANLHKIFLTLYQFHQYQETKRTRARLYAREQATKRKHELYQRWWHFTLSRQRDARRIRYVEQIISRHRYLKLWCKTMVQAHGIGVLHNRITSRILTTHVHAWRLISRALRFSRQCCVSETLLPSALVRWKQYSIRSSRQHTAICAMQRRRQRCAMKWFCKWTQAHQADGSQRARATRIYRRHLLTHMWYEGWLAYHHQKLQERQRAKQVQIMHGKRMFNAWKSLWSAQEGSKEERRMIQQFTRRAPFRRPWCRWLEYIQGRRKDRKERNLASEHYHRQLARRGLYQFLKRHRKHRQCVHIFHTIQAKQHALNKRHCLQQWKQWATERIHLHSRVQAIQALPMFSGSIWNPVYRRWRQWTRFVMLRHHVQMFAGQHSTRSMRAVLGAWKRRTKVFHLAAYYHSTTITKRRLTAFNKWKQHTLDKQESHRVCLIAEQGRRRRLCAVILKRWRYWSCVYQKQTHAHALEVKERHRKRQLKQFYSCWNTQYIRSTGVQELLTKRRLLHLELVLKTWQSLTIKARKIKSTLHQFTQNCGRLYATTSCLFRVWKVWVAHTQLQRTVNTKIRTYKMRIILSCFMSWKTYKVARYILQAWHEEAIISAATNNDLGKRIRQFREKRGTRQLGDLFHYWSQQVLLRDDAHKQITARRQQLLREIRQEHASGTSARLHVVRIWWSRWKRAHTKTLRIATQFFFQRECHHVLRAWWRVMIHSKQERVLLEARNAMHKLSGYHPAVPSVDSYQVATLKTKSSSSKKLIGVSNVIHTTRNKAPSSSSRGMETTYQNKWQTKRCMTDPKLNHNYIAKYQEKVTRGRDDSLGEGHRHAKKSIKKSKIQPPLQAEFRSEHKETFYRGELENSSPCMVGHRVSQSGTQTETEGANSVLKIYPNESGNDQLTPRCDDYLVEKPVEPLNLQDERPPSPTIMQQPDHESPRGMKSQVSPCNSTPVEVVHQPFSGAWVSTSNDNTNEESIMSLEGLAEMDVYEENESRDSLSSLHKSPRQCNTHKTSLTITSPRRCNTHKTSVTVSSPRKVRAFDCESKPLVKKGPKWAPSRSPKADQEKRRNVENEPLACLLDLRSSETVSAPQVESTRTLNSNASAKVHSDDVVQDIISYYANKTKIRSTQTACYIMTRDLGLFTSEYYIDAMKKSLASAMEKEQTRTYQLQEYLRTMVENHPLYIVSHQHERIRPFEWLVHKLLPRVSPTEAGGGWKPLTHPRSCPIEIEVALDKLLKCIKKYQVVLETFFAWRNSSSRVCAGSKRRPLAKSMEKSQFIALLQHQRVFPQLLNQREVDSALTNAVCRTDRKGALYFSEFVEALIRCSACLQWNTAAVADSSDSDTTEIVVVVKFLMLLFAMEGRGSVLNKRNEDLQLVVGFLEQARLHKKAEKNLRFQQLLKSQPVMPITYERKSEHVNRQNAVARNSRPRSTRNAESTVRAHTLVTNGSDERNTRATTSVIPIQCNRNHTDDADDRSKTNNPSEQTDLVISDEVQSAPSDIREQLQERLKLREAQLQHQGEPNQDKVDVDPFTINNNTTTCLTAVASSGGFQTRPPMSNDAFLEEIMNSIDDVELLLQQTETTRRTHSRASYMSEEYVNDSVLTSEPFSAAYPERHKVVNHGELPSQIHPSSTDEHSISTLEMAHEVQVFDPLLDQLTQIDRFTESTDTSKVSLMELTEHGFYGVFPSRFHSLPPVEGMELHDLTIQDHNYSFSADLEEIRYH